MSKKSTLNTNGNKNELEGVLNNKILDKFDLKFPLADDFENGLARYNTSNNQRFLEGDWGYTDSKGKKIGGDYKLATPIVDGTAKITKADGSHAVLKSRKKNDEFERIFDNADDNYKYIDADNKKVLDQTKITSIEDVTAILGRDPKYLDSIPLDFFKDQKNIFKIKSTMKKSGLNRDDSTLKMIEAKIAEANKVQKKTKLNDTLVLSSPKLGKSRYDMPKHIAAMIDDK